MQNDKALRPNDPLRAPEDVNTDESGRVRIELNSGSTLSLGSRSRMSVLDQSGTPGKSKIRVLNGSLRSRAAKSPSSGAELEIITPHTTITALGADFSARVEPGRTEVIVHSGVVVMSAGQDTQSTSPLLLDVPAGQTATADAGGISSLRSTPADVEQASLAETNVPEPRPVVAETATPRVKAHSHLQRNLLIIGGLAAGGIGAALAAGHGNSSTPSQTPPPATIPTIPGH
jgi:hypothetical protein